MDDSSGLEPPKDKTVPHHLTTVRVTRDGARTVPCRRSSSAAAAWDSAVRDEELIEAAELAWDELDRVGQPGLVARTQVAHVWVAACVMARLLRMTAANQSGRP